MSARMRKSPAFRGTDLVKGRRVKITGSPASWTDGATVEYADADDLNWIGTLEEGVTGEGPVTVNLRNEPIDVEASEAIAIGALAKAGTNGRVAATGTVDTGVLLEAATAAGDIIALMPF